MTRAGWIAPVGFIAGQDRPDGGVSKLNVQLRMSVLIGCQDTAWQFEKECKERVMRWMAAGLCAAAVVATPAAAADTPGSAELSKAWTPAVTQLRSNSPLYMTITNHSDAPDSLIRIRCPTNLADFVEKHATDRGEGGTAMREVKSFAVPAGGTMTLSPGGNHLMLLNIKEALRDGQTFACSIVFQKAGTVPVEVRVVSDETR
ncbi:MAG TPA: copper chaperone PCu(A)C [Rhodopila sp.]